MACVLEATEAAAVADYPADPILRETQEQEAAEFIARQVLDRGATFFDG
jgi:hypothetical protein